MAAITPYSNTPYYKAAVRDKKINITFQEYHSHYTNKEWFSKKVKAIPLFLVSIVVKTTDHLGMAIIMGGVRLLKGDPNRFKAEICNIGRAIETAFGYIVTLFSVERGAYYLDRSQFFIEKNIRWVAGEDYDAPPSNPQNSEDNPTPSPTHKPKSSPPDKSLQKPSSHQKDPSSDSLSQSSDGKSQGKRFNKGGSVHVRHLSLPNGDALKRFQRYPREESQSEEVRCLMRQYHKQDIAELAGQYGGTVSFKTPVMKPLKPRRLAPKNIRQGILRFGEEQKLKKCTTKTHKRRNSTDQAIINRRTSILGSPQEEEKLESESESELEWSENDDSETETNSRRKFQGNFSSSRLRSRSSTTEGSSSTSSEEQEEEGLPSLNLGQSSSPKGSSQSPRYLSDRPNAKVSSILSELSLSSIPESDQSSNPKGSSQSPRYLSDGPNAKASSILLGSPPSAPPLNLSDEPKLGTPPPAPSFELDTSSNSGKKTQPPQPLNLPTSESQKKTQSGGGFASQLAGAVKNPGLRTPQERSSGSQGNPRSAGDLSSQLANAVRKPKLRKTKSSFSIRQKDSPQKKTEAQLIQERLKRKRAESSDKGKKSGKPFSKFRRKVRRKRKGLGKTLLKAGRKVKSNAPPVQQSVNRLRS